MFVRVSSRPVLAVDCTVLVAVFVCGTEAAMHECRLSSRSLPLSKVYRHVFLLMGYIFDCTTGASESMKSPRHSYRQLSSYRDVTSYI